MKKYVLDTSALLCWTYQEDGYLEVQSIIESKNVVLVSFASWTELFYKLKPFQEDGLRSAVYNTLRSLNFTTIWADEDLCARAGYIKAHHILSFADAWIAATAYEQDAILVHKDPEFDNLTEIKQLKLPYKKKAKPRKS